MILVINTCLQKEKSSRPDHTACACPGSTWGSARERGSMAARVSSAPHVNNRNHVTRTTILLQDTVVLVCVTRCITIPTSASCVFSQRSVKVPCQYSYKRCFVTSTPNLMSTYCFINITTVCYQHHHHQQRQFFVALVVSICAVNCLLSC